MAAYDRVLLFVVLVLPAPVCVYRALDSSFLLIILCLIFRGRELLRLLNVLLLA